MRRLVAFLTAVAIVACAPVTPAATSAIAPAPVATDGTSTLPDLPAATPSRMGPVPVYWVDSLQKNGMPAMAGLDVLARRIYLNTAMTNRLVAWQAFFHEECHLVFWDTGLSALVNEPVEEAICDAIGTDRVAIAFGRQLNR